MICNKCNHNLPDDSEFCQYCGNKIEVGFVVSSNIIENTESASVKNTPAMPEEGNKSNFDNMTSDEAITALLKMQAEETVRAMTANSQTQPHNENDADFGLVPEKPIYTLALQSVEGEKEYLNRLFTVNGEKIRYNRRGSMSVEEITGMVDIYDTYLPSGQLYKTIYINMYGAKKSIKAPKGFILAKPKSSTKSIKKSNPNSIHNSPSDKLVCLTNISSMILTIIAMFSIFVALNIQDGRRNDLENWSPTVVYIILLLILSIFLCFIINSLIKIKFKLLSALSTIPVIAAIVTGSEYSIMSSYGYYGQYINEEAVYVCNTIWIMCVVLVMFITLIPFVVVAIKKMNNNWHKSISYREKCYKKVEKIHTYLEKGIISEEEYEETKKQIMSKIR